LDLNQKGSDDLDTDGDGVVNIIIMDTEGGRALNRTAFYANGVCYIDEFNCYEDEKF
jgi:hypothetical protein